MQIKLNDIVFDVAPVPTNLRMALLADPVIAQGVWRDVYHWDAVTQTGKVLVTTTPSGTAPLGNGITFFVPNPARHWSKAKAHRRGWPNGFWKRSRQSR